MTQREGFTGMGIILAFLGGAAAGATAALLLTPKTGEETRRDIRELADKSRKQVTRVPKALREAYSQATEVAKDAFVGAYQTVDQGISKSH